MYRFRAAALWCCLLVGACRIEDRTPTGSRRDDEAIQRVLAQYARALSARDWPAVRTLFWGEATYELATPATNIVLPIDSVRTRLLPPRLAGDTQAFEVRILRSDTRQEGDLAAAWLVSRRRVPHGGYIAEADWTEHVVLRRIGGEWRIINIALAGGARRRS
jgi:hypothetical protein